MAVMSACSTKDCKAAPASRACPRRRGSEAGTNESVERNLPLFPVIPSVQVRATHRRDRKIIVLEIILLV
jgi:hypothetical protein